MRKNIFYAIIIAILISNSGEATSGIDLPYNDESETNINPKKRHTETDTQENINLEKSKYKRPKTEALNQINQHWKKLDEKYSKEIIEEGREFDAARDDIEKRVALILSMDIMTKYITTIPIDLVNFCIRVNYCAMKLKNLQKGTSEHNQYILRIKNLLRLLPDSEKPNKDDLEDFYKVKFRITN